MFSKRLLAALFLAFAATACGGGGDGDRTVLVDYEADEFNSSAFFNFPAKLEAKAGQTVVFKQAWTGEPHTVTGGTFVNESLTKGKDWLAFFEAFDALGASGADLPDPEDPSGATFADFVDGVKAAKDKKNADKVTTGWNNLRASGVPLPDLDNPGTMSWADAVSIVDEESEKAFGDIPFAFGEEDGIAQNVGQPCFKRTGRVPEDPATPCSKAEQRQPEFTGRESVYNSGLIRYEGVRGNSFKVKLADNAKPGTYMFYCAVHGPGQLTQLEVKAKDADVESSGDVARRARAEAQKTVGPLEKQFRTAQRTNAISIDGEKIRGPFAGIVSPGSDHALINEFLPRRIRAKVNEPITWKAMGSDHTISFDVPSYFPILQFDTPEGVRLNPRLGRPTGGAPEIPEQDEEGGILKIDGGTYDGTGFWSSGLFGAEPYAEYTVRISKPGTYGYACLIHPRMLGQVVVS